MLNNHHKITSILTLFIWFITILLFPIGVFASSVTSLGIVDTINPDLSLNEHITLILTNNTQNSTSFSVPVTAYNVFINGDANEGNSNIRTIPLDCIDCEIDISYELKDASKKLGSVSYSFSRTMNFPQSIDYLEYSIKLPPGYILGATNNSGEPSIVPTATSIDTDGESIILFWSQSSPPLPQRFYLKYHSHELTESTLAELSTEFTEWTVWLMMILCVGIGAFGGILIYKKIKPVPKKDFMIPSSLLSLDEKTVLKLLEDNKNTMNQKSIGQELNWSKSKISAIMTNLQYKNIISREKFGRNYKVTVIKKINYL